MPQTSRTKTKSAKSVMTNTSLETAWQLTLLAFLLHLLKYKHPKGHWGPRETKQHLQVSPYRERRQLEGAGHPQRVGAPGLLRPLLAFVPVRVCQISLGMPHSSTVKLLQNDLTQAAVTPHFTSPRRSRGVALGCWEAPCCWGSFGKQQQLWLWPFVGSSSPSHSDTIQKQPAGPVVCPSFSGGSSRQDRGHGTGHMTWNNWETSQLQRPSPASVLLQIYDSWRKTHSLLVEKPEKC